MNQTLDDIIKSRRLVSKQGGGAKGKFNTFRSTTAAGLKAGRSPAGLTTKKFATKFGRALQVGPKIVPMSSRLGDARIKIIAKKRQNLVDARDQLNEIARQSDAREKLILLRAKKITSKPKSLFTKALGNLKGGGIAKQRNQGGFVTKRQKVNTVPLHKLTRTVQQEPSPRSYLQMGRLGRAEPLHDIDVEVYNDLDAVDRMSPPLRRERLPDYDELLAMYAKNKIQRVPTSQPSRAQVSKRPVASYQTQSHQAMRKAGSSGMRMDQYYQEESEEEEDEEMEMEVAPHQATKFMGRSIHSKQQPTNVFRRVQNPAPAPVRATSGYRKPVAEGYRVRVSNLAPSVTKDDIMELYSDPGPLSSWDLLPGGIAEVFYKKRSDAISAVDAYHKRLLDGQPMTVTFYD